MGANFSIKIQFYILGAVVLSLFSFYSGAIPAINPRYIMENAGPAYSAGKNFWSMFALYFPAVTGIMAGVGMSGDLKKPSRSIPYGTLAAVGSTYLVYLSFVFLLGAVFPRNALLGDNLTVKRISTIPFFIDIGMFAATLSSAMGSFLGAPRVLQQLARDKIWPFLSPFARGSGPNDEPKAAVTLTFILATFCIWVTDLNIIAPIITMFFMITYGLTNFAAFYEAYSKNPSFRPTFKFFHWGAGISGFLACTGVMLLIDYKYAIISLCFFYMMYKYIEHSQVSTTFGDAKSGFIFSRIRSSLVALLQEEDHFKNWRPKILILFQHLENLKKLIRYGNWMECHRGIITVAKIIEGNFEKYLYKKFKNEERLLKYIKDNELQVFPEVLLSPDFVSGVQALLQSHSIGTIKPNTLMLNWPDNPDKLQAYGRILRDAFLLKKNIVIIKENENPPEEIKGTSRLIDIWWRGEDNGNLMLLFAYLLKQNHEWKNSNIRILRLIEEECERETANREMKEMVELTRIRAETLAIQAYGIDEMKEKIEMMSGKSNIVFVGMMVPEEGREELFMKGFSSLLENLPAVVLVKALGRINLSV